MEKRTVIDRIEVEPLTGNIGVRLSKRIVEDDGRAIASEYHRMMIAPETNVEEYLSTVNDHLVGLGYPPINQTDMSVLLDTVAFHRSKKS